MKELTTKQYLELWDDYAERMLNSITLDLNETPAQQKKRIKRLEANPEAWFKHYFPEESSAEPADFHKKATKRVLNNPEWYEVRMWSRELAKSTRTMMEVLYLCLTGKKKYVLFVSNSKDNAVELLMPYKMHLELNPRIIHDYGEQEKPGKWESHKFTSKAGFAFRGVGLGQTPRGAKNKNVRPDVILFDDVDTDEDCRNPDMITKNWRWIERAAMPTRSISVPTLKIWCGNKIAVDCCVLRASKLAKHTDIINITDDDGNSTWPQKNTPEHIRTVLSEISYASQQQEYFNNPITEGAVFEKMTYKPARPIREYELLVCYTDPSYKDSKKNDYKATVLVGLWQGEFHVIKAFVEQTTTAVMIDWHYDIMDIVGDHACYYFMEQVFLQDIFLKEFYATGAKKKKVIPIKGDDRQKPDKFTRIESLLEPLNRNGKLYLNEREKDNPHMQRLEEQFIAISPKSRAHDDGPDAVEGAVWMINTKIVTKPDDIIVFKRKKNSKRY